MTLPDTQERYPSREQIKEWAVKHCGAGSQIEWIVRQACDWHSHQCREQVARWMMDHGYATGHGDTIEDLLGQIVWQVRERDALNTPPPLPNQEQPND